MTPTLPTNLHAEVALDRGRLSHAERSGARSIFQARATAADPHARVQSQHGVIMETTHFVPNDKHGMIIEEPEGRTLSGAELAAALDTEEGFGDGEDIGTQRAVMHEAQWYEERSPKSSASFSAMQTQQPQVHAQHYQQQRPLAPHQYPRNSSTSQQPHTDSYPQSILQNRDTTLSPPPRSSSGSVPASAPAQQQAFPDKPRFALSDDGPVSAPPSPGGHPAIPRAVSDSYPHAHSEPSSPGLGVTPPSRRGGAHSQPATPRYATFEEMGIHGKGMAQAQAEKDARDCVIM